MSNEDVTRFGPEPSLESGGRAQEPVNETRSPRVGVHSVGATYFGDTWSGSVDRAPLPVVPGASNAQKRVEPPSRRPETKCDSRTPPLKLVDLAPPRGRGKWKTQFEALQVDRLVPTHAARRGLLVVCGAGIGLLAASASLFRSPQAPSQGLDLEQSMNLSSRSVMQAGQVTEPKAAPVLLSKRGELDIADSNSAEFRVYELDAEQFPDAEAALLAALAGNCDQALAAYRKLHYVDAPVPSSDLPDQPSRPSEQRWRPFLSELGRRCGTQGAKK